MQNQLKIIYIDFTIKSNNSAEKILIQLRELHSHTFKTNIYFNFFYKYKDAVEKISIQLRKLYTCTLETNIYVDFYT